MLITSFFNFYNLYSQDKNNQIQYEKVSTNLFPGFENAKLIVDYYYSEGISFGDRYSYEIIVADTVLMVAFHSSESEDYNKIEYENKSVLRKCQVDSLLFILSTAGLTQLKEGIPRPDYSAHIKEVLIVKSDNLLIRGGMFCSLIDCEDSNLTFEELRRIEKESNSSIGGNYEIVIEYLNNFFIERKTLLMKVYKD